ncbi:TfoX/Sxy family protein [Polymorphobacter sp. PAMC 29334]|uniref:TfoX/Sxy family protein n=1 Tax=Polymorphobacter sp. PAMC 29334 TaxID=2862331 RepID=UPI001C66286F|nr:TfoX/Sxy family protein [Polymorphobacter sp. PAMC 29334]QYE35918.1 TfoX/Sxy family protein [Polymorphobacter sp. PAMC 29334]
MATDPADLQAQLLAAAPDLDLSFRKMFGGIMGYAAGVVFASLSDVGLALKLSGTERDRALALPGALPLRYEPDAPSSKSYVVLPSEVVADSAALHDWAVASVAGLKPKPVKKAKG